MTDEKIELHGKLEVPVTATQESEIITGDDLTLMIRAFGAKDPGPILAAAREDPELLQFLSGFAELDKVAEGVEEALGRLDKDKSGG